jgi:hypothetical protein
MRVKLFCLMIFITMSLCVFAEEGRETGTGISIPLDTGKLILHQNSIMFTPFNYQFSDGTPLVNRNKLRQILNIPGNEKLLKEEKGWRLTAVIFGVVGITATVMHGMYLLSDLPNRDIMMVASYVGEVVSLAGGVFWTGTVANNKIARAVDNYNAFILGIPVK